MYILLECLHSNTIWVVHSVFVMNRQGRQGRQGKKKKTLLSSFSQETVGGQKALNNVYKAKLKIYKRPEESKEQLIFCKVGHI